MESPDTNGNCLAEASGGEIVNPISLWDILLGGAGINPEGIALISLQQPAHVLSPLFEEERTKTPNDSHLVWRYKELQQRAEKFASTLKLYGVHEGDIITCFLWNTTEWCLLFWAAACLGATLATLDPRVIDRTAELNHCLGLLNSSAIIVEDLTEAMKLASKVPDRMLVSMRLRLILSLIDPRDKIPNGWTHLGTFQNSTSVEQQQSKAAMNRETDKNHETAMILFTSGTTSFPKGCPLTHENISCGTACFKDSRGLSRSSKFLVHGPCFHIQSFHSIVCTWRAGGSVVFPSKRFNPAASLDALVSQQITHMTCAPSMIRLMEEQASIESKSKLKLERVWLGAEKISSKVIADCKSAFAMEGVKVGYGMTEAHCVTAWKTSDIPTTCPDGFVGVGRVLPGSNVKICKPGTHRIVKIGELGELHIGGQTVIKRYLGDVNVDSFYPDKLGTWFISGDQAMMDTSGTLYITGRYKDIIIRGGENISLATIEECLNSQSDVLECRVVGIPDDIAGELPVAVIKTMSTDANTLRYLLHQQVSSTLGVSFALKEILTLEDLEISAFPTTTSGKIQTTELRNIVMKELSLRQERRSKQEIQHGSDYASILQKIWGNILGVDPMKLIVNESLVGYADSLTIMRVSSEIQSRIGQRLSSHDLLINDTIEKQSRILTSQLREMEYPGGKTRPPTQTCSNPTDVTTELSEGEFDSGQASTAIGVQLEKLGLFWEEDVEDVLPMKPGNGAGFPAPRPQSWNWRWCYEIPNKTATDIRHGLEIALSHHPIMRAIWAQLPNNSHVYVILKPSAKWFDLCIRYANQGVNNAAQLPSILPKETSQDFAIPPHPLFRAVITPIETTGNLGLVLYVHHCLYDAITAMQFFKDFDSVLTHGQDSELPTRTPYRPFLDTLRQRGCTSATRDVNFHVERLRGFSKHSAAFWPQQRAPGRFIGAFTGWKGEQCGSCGTHLVRKPLDAFGDCRGSMGIERRALFDSLRSLQADYGIAPSTVVKAALALSNVDLTGASAAVFSNTDAGRIWPFQDSWIAAHLPSPMTIAGPTMTAALNVIHIHPSQSLLDFLTHVQKEQKRMSEGAHAPVERILAALGNEARFYLPAMLGQCYNWDPSMRAREGGRPFETLQLVHRELFLEQMVFYNCGLRDEKELIIQVLYDDCQLSVKEVEHVLDLIFGYVTIITDLSRRNQTLKEAREKGNIGARHPKYSQL